MEKSFEKINQAESVLVSETAEDDVKNSVERMYSEALTGEGYENVAEALNSVGELQNFRKSVSELPFSSFHELIEVITNLNKLTLSQEEKNKQTETIIATMRDRASHFSPQVSDLYQAMLSEIQGESYEPHFDITLGKMTELKKDGDFDILFSEDASWGIKLNRIETRLIEHLKGLRARDKREGKEMDDDTRKWREEELKKSPTRPPQRRNESRPGVDPMERLKEGERVSAIWSINPAWGGYYKEQSFSKWDSERNMWVEDEYVYDEAETFPLSDNEDFKKGQIDITMRANIVSGRWVTLPVPYTHNFHKIESGGRNYHARKDQNGDIVILIEGEGEGVLVNAFLAPHPDKKFKSKDIEAVEIPHIPSEFSEETNNKLEEIAAKKRGNIARAQAIKSYTVKRIQYLAPKDHGEAERYNDFYRSSPKGFAGAVDEIKKGDCDVVNTYFAALCAKIGIPVRHCVGHSVKGKDKEGMSMIHSGTGHGWSEVWDEVRKEWMRMDATPAGDPNLEEEDEKEGDMAAPGDYGDPEAVRPTDEELEDLRERLAERKEKLSYTKEERELAEGAGIDLKEARQIVKEINEVEQTRLPNGELIIDVLSRLFNAIVESRKSMAMAYEGPVRKREGGEAIEDIIRHKIGIISGETDPLSREKPAEEIKEEKVMGGFDLYMIGDKSGSMQNVAEGERLWQMQRRAEYLIFSALHRFERNLERAGLQKENSLSIRTQGISFRGSSAEDIDLDKSLSPNFTAKDKVKMWHSLTEQGSGNGDVAALSHIYGQIKGEIEKIEKSGGKDNRLRLVVPCSDGGPDNPLEVQELAEKLGKLNAVVFGIGLTETAAAVPVIYNTSHSKGDIVLDINDLPAVVAKHIVLEAIKLFPDKARESAGQIIENTIAKFKDIN